MDWASPTWRSAWMSKLGRLTRTVCEAWCFQLRQPKVLGAPRTVVKTYEGIRQKAGVVHSALGSSRHGFRQVVGPLDGDTFIYAAFSRLWSSTGESQGFGGPP